MVLFSTQKLRPSLFRRFSWRFDTLPLCQKKFKTQVGQVSLIISLSYYNKNEAFFTDRGQSMGRFDNRMKKHMDYLNLLLSDH